MDEAEVMAGERSPDAFTLSMLRTAASKSSCDASPSPVAKDHGQIHDQPCEPLADSRLLSSAIPQDPRKRRVVGTWVHGVAQSRIGATALRRAPSPHLPADTGFYDLRVPEARREHADLAREHGLNAFCYWHYWFDGRRLLERPFQEVLVSRVIPTFPSVCAGRTRTGRVAWTARTIKC